PPLFLLGIPELQSFSDNFILKQVGKLMIPPLAALYIFGALFLMYHLTVVLTFLSQHPFVHNGYLAVLLLLSFSMWRPIASLAPNAKGQIKRYVLISGLVLMPACLLFIITAIVGGVNNPLLTQMTAALCISPSQLSSFNILPSPFNTSYDQMMAGILMIGMHKLGLILTVRLRNIVQRGIRVEIVE
ncbi:MAG: cytochrome c oxidase assembly protein, partial [Bacillus sp. (in: firmicutes)]